MFKYIFEILYKFEKNLNLKTIIFVIVFFLDKIVDIYHWIERVNIDIGYYHFQNLWGNL